jgi:D-erythronate 2-dehydrogenase
MSERMIGLLSVDLEASSCAFWRPKYVHVAVQRWRAIRCSSVRAMRVLVVGAAGMLGRKLVTRLAHDGVVAGARVTGLSLVDVVQPALPDGAAFPVEAVVADVAEAGVATEVMSSRPDVVFHLAAVLSGEAEADLEEGYRVNLDGTRFLFDSVRRVGSGYRPRVVFASSIAVFGAPFPAVIGDDYHTTPLTSYGTQKAMCELLLADYSRRGYLDGVGVRLPTICVRPGRPNRAASGFFSSIIREPLNGEDAVLPVPDEVRHWFASPRAAVDFLVHAAAIESAALGDRRCLTMPGVSETVAGQIAALRKIAGDEAVRRIRREPDETIMRIVAGWPGVFDARRAVELGFRADADFEEIVWVYVEDELGGRIGRAHP